MTGYYIHFNARATLSISNKIDMQMKELSKISKVSEVNVQIAHRSMLKRIISLFPYVSADRYEIEGAFSRIINPDFVYIRKTNGDKQYIHFLEMIKEKYPNCKIIVEIYTYPFYRDDFFRWDAWPYLFKELEAKKFYSKFIDFFVTYSKDSSIYNVPTIRIANGIRTSEYTVAKLRNSDGEIHLSGIAFFQKHHGYERIIKGLNSYYTKGNTRCVNLYLAGKGPEESKYKKLVNKYNLEEHVIFLGELSGHDLDKLYDNTDIVLSGFGGYKDHVKVSSALKVRECLAKGIPVISGYIEDIFENKSVDFFMKFPDDSSEVDIDSIVKFYDRLYGDKNVNSLRRRIRDFAEEYAEISETFKPVLSQIIW